MPIYEYECANCGTFERLQSMSDEPLKRCPECRRKVSRLISSSSFHLRGGGWYADSYDSKSAKSKDKGDVGGDSTVSADAPKSTPDKATTSDAKKPAAAPKTKKNSSAA